MWRLSYSTCFILIGYSMYGRVLCRLRDKAKFRSKIKTFHRPLHGKNLLYNRARRLGIQYGAKFNPVSRVHVATLRTDRWNCGANNRNYHASRFIFSSFFFIFSVCFAWWTKLATSQLFYCWFTMQYTMPWRHNNAIKILTAWKIYSTLSYRIGSYRT